MEDRPIFSNKDQVYTLRMDKKLSEQFKKLAEQRKMKPSRLIRELIRIELQKTLPPEPKPVGRPRKLSTELKSSLAKAKELERSDIELGRRLSEMMKEYRKYQDEINKTVGAYIVEAQKNGKLDAELSEVIKKMIDDV